MSEIRLTLAAARVNAGLTQTEAAKRLGFSRDKLIKLENGKQEPRKFELIALGQVYGIPVEAFLLPSATT